MSYPIDLSITGKPSPRTNQRIGSGRRKQTPLNANRSRNERSNIFGGGIYGKDEKGERDNRYAKKNSKGNAGVISKTDLDNVLEITNRNQKEKLNQTDQAVYPVARKAAPEGVPRLALDVVTGGEEEIRYNKVTPREYKVHSPTSKDTYSWGTPLDDKNNNLKTKPNTKGGGWQVNKSRGTRKPASANRKYDEVPDLELSLSKSNEALKSLAKTAKQVQEDLKIEYMGNYKNGEVYVEKTMQQPDAKRNKKVDFVEQTLLLDQMKLDEEKPASQQTQFGVHERLDSRVKRHRDMYSKNAGPNCIEDDLTRRLHFGARIITLNDHDARRDVNGFFFADDCSLTVYEYRQFGTKSTALPLIHRGIYMHARGIRKGKPFCLFDVTTGKDLTFATTVIDKLPESLRGTPLLVFRVTDVNEMDKNKLLYSKHRTAKDRANMEQFVKSYQLEEEAYLKKLKRASFIKNDICQKIKPFGVKLLTNIFQHFKQMNRLQGDLLTKDQFEAALKKFHLNISSQNFDIIWASTDRIENNKLNAGEFMRLFFGEMNENRKRWVFKAFSRVDPKKRGYGPIDEIKKFYNASLDPKVVKGELSEKEAMNELLECFQHRKDKTDISFSEFEVYYEGLSLNYLDDAQFIQQVRASWTI